MLDLLDVARDYQRPSDHHGGFYQRVAWRMRQNRRDADAVALLSDDPRNARDSSGETERERRRRAGIAWGQRLQYTLLEEREERKKREVDGSTWSGWTAEEIQRRFGHFVLASYESWATRYDAEAQIWAQRCEWWSRVAEPRSILEKVQRACMMVRIEMEAMPVPLQAPSAALMLASATPSLVPLARSGLADHSARTASTRHSVSVPLHGTASWQLAAAAPTLQLLAQSLQSATSGRMAKSKGGHPHPQPPPSSLQTLVGAAPSLVPLAQSTYSGIGHAAQKHLASDPSPLSPSSDLVAATPALTALAQPQDAARKERATLSRQGRPIPFVGQLSAQHLAVGTPCLLPIARSMEDGRQAVGAARSKDNPAPLAAAGSKPLVPATSSLLPLARSTEAQGRDRLAVSRRNNPYPMALPSTETLTLPGTPSLLALSQSGKTVLEAKTRATKLAPVPIHHAADGPLILGATPSLLGLAEPGENAVRRRGGATRKGKSNRKKA